MTQSKALPPVVYSTTTPEPPGPSIEEIIIEGEAGVCGFEGKLAVAWILSRTNYEIWSTHKLKLKRVTKETEEVAKNWKNYDDPTNGAMHLFSKEDLKNEAVKRIIKGKEYLWKIDCAGGLALYAYP